jgi:hypothetical protein
VYLRAPRRTNRDGSVVRYLQLAHNERHPVTGSPVAKVIHNFGRADRVDREALGRLVASISRFLEPDRAVAAAAGTEVEILDSRRLGRGLDAGPDLGAPGHRRGDPLRGRGSGHRRLRGVHR